jgi:hypothetical protein
VWGFSDTFVYDWSGWKGSLITTISPRARRIRAKVSASPQRCANRLPRRAKLLIVHLDISDNAPFIEDAGEFGRSVSERGVTVFNAAVSDIRKRSVQACCKAFGLPSVRAAADGNPEEMLIVKTDLNSGGTQERQLPAKLKARFKLPVRAGLINNASEYFVKRRADVDIKVWDDPELVVERYMANRLGRFFRVYFAGNAVVISEAYDATDVKRMGGDIRRQNYWLWRQEDILRGHSGSEPALPPALLATAGRFAHGFKLDYGALDIVENDGGEFYVVDVNKTPYWGTERQPGLVEHLRLGLSEITQS